MTRVRVLPTFADPIHARAVGTKGTVLGIRQNTYTILVELDIGPPYLDPKCLCQIKENVWQFLPSELEIID